MLYVFQCMGRYNVRSIGPVLLLRGSGSDRGHPSSD